MEKIKLFCTSVCTALAYIFGGMDTMLNILLIFMVIDFVSGFIKAWALKEFDSSKFYIGGMKKTRHFANCCGCRTARPADTDRFDGTAYRNGIVLHSKRGIFDT